MSKRFFHTNKLTVPVSHFVQYNMENFSRPSVSLFVGDFLRKSAKNFFKMLTVEGGKVCLVKKSLKILDFSSYTIFE